MGFFGCLMEATKDVMLQHTWFAMEFLGVIGNTYFSLLCLLLYSYIVLGVWWIWSFRYLVGFTSSLLYFWRKKSTYFEHLVWKLSLGCVAPGVKYFLDSLNTRFLLSLAFSSCPLCFLGSNQILMQILSLTEVVAWILMPTSPSKCCCDIME